MKEMLAMLALKAGIRAAYWIGGRIRRRLVTEQIHAEVDKALEKRRMLGAEERV